MMLRFPELPGWELQVEEVSADVHAVGAFDQKGARFETTGSEVDLDRVMAEAKQFAIGIEALQRGRRDGS